LAHADHPLADLYPRPLVPPRATVGSGYRSSATRARWTRGLLGLAVVANMASLLALGVQRAMLDRGVGGFTLADWDSSRSRVNAAASIGLLILLVTGVFFLCWLHRSYRNLAELAVGDLRFTPGWAVGYWFVPVLNLFRPKQIVDDLWRASAGPATGGEPWRSRSSSGLVTLWWLAFVSSGIVVRLASFGGSSTLAHVKRENALLFLGHVLYVVAGAAAFRLVGTVTARQESRAAQLSVE
jgi:hypothetical protein